MKHKNKPLIKSSFSILLISGLLCFLFVFNSVSKEIPEAELRFAEYSDNKNVRGSILPASCESAPKSGSAHFPGDSSGSCACAVTGQTCNGDYIYNHKAGCGVGFNVAYCTYGCTNNGGTPNSFGPRCNDAPTGPNCPATTVNWAPGCSAYVGASYTGNVINVTNSAAGYTGNNSVSCNGSSVQIDGATFSGIQPSCNVIPPPVVTCPAQTVSWGNGCSATVGPLQQSVQASGFTSTINSNPTIQNTAAGYTGSAGVSCDGNTISIRRPNTCVTNTPPQVQINFN